MRRRGVGDPPDDLVALCRAEHPRLVRALDLVTGDLAVAEELAQEALVRLWQRWPAVRRHDRPAAWLHRVGMNLAISAHRRRGAERRALARAASRAATEPAGAIEAPDPVLRAALARLPDGQRAAVVLRYLLDLPVADVAIALDLTPGAVRALTFRAVAALRSDLGGLLVDETELEDSPYAQ